MAFIDMRRLDSNSPKDVPHGQAASLVAGAVERAAPATSPE